MKGPFSARFVAVTGIAIAAFGAALAAQARTDVYVSVGMPGRPVYVAPAPVDVRPQPVYVQPRPGYMQPPPYAYRKRSVGGVVAYDRELCKPDRVATAR